MIHDSDIFYAALLLLQRFGSDLRGEDNANADADADANADADTNANADGCGVAVGCYDNRDLTINHFEILVQTDHSVPTSPCVSSAHTHAILSCVVLLTDVSKPPKKGEVVRYNNGESLDRRCCSLLRTVQFSDKYLTEQEQHND